MHQPELGLKVAELRSQKGLTQEHLAEQCEVSARTIQRIESGEVDPRAYTLNCLSNILEFDFMEADTRSESLWLAALHLSSIFCILPIPLLMWSWKKGHSSKIDQQGRAVLNFQITMTMLLFMGLFCLMLAPVGLILLGTWVDEPGTLVGIMTFLLPLPLIAIGIFCTYQGVINAIRSLSDKHIKYPLSIPFVK